MVRAHDLAVIQTNPAWRAMFAVSVGEEAQFPSFSPGGETPDKASSQILRALDRKNAWRVEAEIVRNDGTTFWGRLNLTAAHHRTHRAVWIVECTNLTADHETHVRLREALAHERRSGDDLRRADSDKDQFLAMVSEELNRPLAALLGHVDLLRGRYQRMSPEVVAKSLEQMSISINGMASLADRLVYVLRLDSGLANIAPVRLHLHTEIKGSLGVLSHLVRDRAVTVEVADDLMVRVDPDAISRILAGLLTNAVKYSEPGSALVIRAGDAGPGWVRVEVQDHGRGMSAARLQAVFDRVPGGWRRNSPGLGLRIIHQFVRLHGGSVGASSELGSGTTVWFTLPDAQSAPD